MYYFLINFCHHILSIVFHSSEKHWYNTLTHYHYIIWKDFVTAKTKKNVGTVRLHPTLLTNAHNQVSWDGWVMIDYYLFCCQSFHRAHCERTRPLLPDCTSTQKQRHYEQRKPWVSGLQSHDQQWCAKAGNVPEDWW